MLRRHALIFHSFFRELSEGDVELFSAEVFSLPPAEGFAFSSSVFLGVYFAMGGTRDAFRHTFHNRVCLACGRMFSAQEWQRTSIRRIASYFFRAAASEDDFLLRLERNNPRFAGPRGCRGRSRDPERKAWGCGNLGPGMFIGGDALRLKGPA